MTVALQSPLEGQRISGRRAVLRPLRTVTHQLRYDLLSLLRNRTAQGFAIAMPISFLVLFVAIFGNGAMRYEGQLVRGSTYYVAAISVFAVVDVAFMALVISLVEVRESGVLRRRRATPQPAWAIIASRALTALVTGLASAGLLLVIGRLAYGASLPVSAVPALAVGVLAGVLTFACLGFAVAGLVRTFQSASRWSWVVPSRSPSSQGCSSRGPLCRIGSSTSLRSSQCGPWPWPCSIPTWRWAGGARGMPGPSWSWRPGAPLVCWRPCAPSSGPPRTSELAGVVGAVAPCQTVRTMQATSGTSTRILVLVT